MEYKAFQDIQLSRLGMGNMRLPIVQGRKDTDIDKEKATEIIDYAMANGINYFDTAYVYHGGASEKFLGEALVDRYPRDSFYLATKFLIFASKDYKAVFEEQLSRLHTDYIDFYLIHGINNQIAQQYIDIGAVDYFMEQKKAGRIKYLGFSSHASTETLEKFAGHHAWDFAQIQLNYFDWLFGSTKQEYEILAEKNIPIMVMEPVRGGRLAGLTPDAEKMLKDAQPDWSVPSWALHWVKSLPQVQVVLSGMSNMAQIEDNVRTFSDEKTATKEEEALLFKACELFREQIKVPCTGCRYCCDSCPAQINIPEVLKIYNDYKLQGGWVLGRLKDIQSEGGPKDCVGCGACTQHCPQNIDVPAIMKELGGQLR